LLQRPAFRWTTLLGIGLTLFAGQFLLLFFAIKLGLPPGVASITQQMQAFFTVLLGALFLQERPSDTGRNTFPYDNHLCIIQKIPSAISPL
jgi:O-acetylserine/cysteine efflux transporter